MTHEDVDGVGGALGDFARSRIVRYPRTSEQNLRQDRMCAPSLRNNEKLRWPVDLDIVESR